MTVQFNKMVSSEIIEDLNKQLKEMDSKGLFSKKLADNLNSGEEIFINDNKARDLYFELTFQKKYKLAAQIVYIRLNYLMSKNIQQIMENDVRSLNQNVLQFWKNCLVEVSYFCKHNYTISNFGSLLDQKAMDKSVTVEMLEELFHDDKVLLDHCSELYKNKCYDELSDLIYSKLSIIVYQNAENTGTEDYLKMPRVWNVFEFKKDDLDTDEWKFWFALQNKIESITDLNTKPTKKFIDKTLKDLSEKAIPELKKKGLFSSLRKNKS